MFMDPNLKKYLKRYYTSIYWIIIRLLSIIPSQYLRKLILKYIFRMKISLKAVLYNGFKISKANKIEVGHYSVIGHNVTLDGRAGIDIGENVNISSEVMIWTEQHDYNDPNFKIVGGKVIIEDFVWISARAIILPGIKVGKGAVVAAGSVVTKNIPPYSIVAGIPARKIGKREGGLKYHPSKPFLPFI